MPWNDPYTAAPSLWSFRDAMGVRYASSVAPSMLAKPDRMALECYLIWQYRLATSESPWCNFGRLHPRYNKSRNRSTSQRGFRLPDDQLNPAVGPCYPPLVARGDSCDSKWMGRDWNGPLDFETAAIGRVPDAPGVYRVRATDNVVYIGESANLRARLSSHRQRPWDASATFAFVSLPDVRLKCQRLEIENDLIAAFFAARKRVPLRQFAAR